jgi:hypothetical protein
VIVGPAAPAPTNRRITYVSFSEVNDLLSYELVPYFEHEYYMRCRVQPFAIAGFDAGCASGGAMQAVLKLKPKGDERRALVKELGFNVVDVRVRFAPPISRFIAEYADPQEAHTGYMRSGPVRQAIICGTDGKKVRGPSDGCVAP